MDVLSKRLIVVRYGVVLAAMCAVVFGYRVATNHMGVGSLATPVIFAIFCAKYLLFDVLVSMVRRRWPKLKVLPWLWIGYGAAAATDIVVTWIAVSDDTGNSLALILTILLSPWFLAGALALMVLHTLIARKR